MYVSISVYGLLHYRHGGMYIHAYYACTYIHLPYPYLIIIIIIRWADYNRQKLGGHALPLTRQTFNVTDFQNFVLVLAGR